MQRRYEADVLPEQAWSVLASEPGATLVDVRTVAEWNYVGLPDLSSIGAPLLRVEWQSFPSGEVNASFVDMMTDALEANDVGRDAPIFFICRSGARSASAAAVMTDAGYAHCYNVASGFEGQRDDTGHRGSVDGWKVAGLPWVQS